MEVVPIVESAKGMPAAAAGVRRFAIVRRSSMVSSTYDDLLWLRQHGAAPCD